MVGRCPPRIPHSASAQRALQRQCDLAAGGLSLPKSCPLQSLQQSRGIKFVSPCLWDKQGQGCTVEMQSSWGTSSKVGFGGVGAARTVNDGSVLSTGAGPAASLCACVPQSQRPRCVHVHVPQSQWPRCAHVHVPQSQWPRHACVCVPQSQQPRCAHVPQSQQPRHACACVPQSQQPRCACAHVLLCQQPRCACVPLGHVPGAWAGGSRCWDGSQAPGRVGCRDSTGYWGGAGQSLTGALRLEADYYGKELQKSEDLKTNACITSARPVSKLVRDALERIHEEVVARYYGCGLVIPECLTSCWILDLGSGSGRDCYLLSQLVGEQGHVTGIDMTEGQVEVAKKHIAYHTDKFGYRKPNVEFFHGYMEKLGDAGLADESYDIVISNCVINLAPDKRAVLQEAFRVLKPGGEMYFSDVYASQRLSETIRKHRVLWGECLAGALYWRDLYSIAEEVGFSPPCLVTASPITIGDKELEGIVGDCRFVSATYRLFKLPAGSRTGPAQVTYNGGIVGHERELVFDANFTFKEGEVVNVDAEMAAILRSSRFAEKVLIRAGGANAAAPQGCCSKGVKEKICDPFQLMERLRAPGPARCPGGTCGPQGAAQS
uniref:Arsenite methyltransferase n=1 Tax=Zonotrichia albicollis TaxID=44394 RepID=A0A8D2MHD6_ZONAL